MAKRKDERKNSKKEKPEKKLSRVEKASKTQKSGRVQKRSRDLIQSSRNQKANKPVEAKLPRKTSSVLVPRKTQESRIQKSSNVKRAVKRSREKDSDHVPGFVATKKTRRNEAAGIVLPESATASRNEPQQADSKSLTAVKEREKRPRNDSPDEVQEIADLHASKKLREDENNSSSSSSNISFKTEAPGRVVEVLFSAHPDVFDASSDVNEMNINGFETTVSALEIPEPLPAFYDRLQSSDSSILMDTEKSKNRPHDNFLEIEKEILEMNVSKKMREEETKTIVDANVSQDTSSISDDSDTETPTKFPTQHRLPSQLNEMSILNVLEIIQEAMPDLPEESSDEWSEEDDDEDVLSFFLQKLGRQEHEVTAVERQAKVDDCKMEVDTLVCEETKEKKDEKIYCATCNRKLGLTAIQCRCGGFFCAKHRYSNEHNCTFDYRELGRQEIRRNNPQIEDKKIEKF